MGLRLAVYFGKGFTTSLGRGFQPAWKQVSNQLVKRFPTALLPEAAFSTQAAKPPQPHHKQLIKSKLGGGGGGGWRF